MSYAASPVSSAGHSVRGQQASDTGTLVILPSLRCTVMPDGDLVLTRKFLDGVLEFKRHWGDDIVVLVEEATRKIDDLDQVRFSPDSFEVPIRVVDYLTMTAEDLAGASVVLGFTEHRQNHIAKLCQDNGISCVYGTEYTLRTRLQIAEVSDLGFLRRMRRKQWERAQERRQVDAISTAAGLQCNGLPTWHAYRTTARETCLYFDVRTTEDMVATDADILARVNRLRAGEPLRLVFSGRLIKMKGAHHLIPMAKALKDAGVEFLLTICGDGVLRESMEAEVAAGGLEAHVRFTGIIDFHDELTPLVKYESDLFVCCHLQGDPSCTYLETMACGVPIVGYANEAFDGLASYSETGWTVAESDLDGLVAQIKALDADRELLIAESTRVRDFAREHTFEKTFARRTEFLKDLVQLDS